MLTRFHALIVMISNVRSDISFSDSRVRTRSYSSSGTPSGARVVSASVQASAARSRGMNRVDSRQAAR